ncbi:ABC transporter substrate-binding protein [Actinokineospora diospyrosa]|uniref:Cellobiose-binding protein n=1 Tax=Actinokineospora diospyrosa TaxID=103728 RepID=A0ABT1IBX2_9PSEU|nr:extracellular solute-binding protein [Actinokineospora diospyrosa]MCP2270129.1 cellobiose-binding protein [Actinokineospora diospyrosa]
MRRGRVPWVLAVIALGVQALAGCTASAGQERVRITVATFGEFGYEPLFAEYERLNPGIDLVGRVTDFDSHHKGLITALAAGRGAADVVAVEEQYLPALRHSRDKLVDLARFGARDLAGRWAPWKWEQGVVGDAVLGLGTDMGGLAMCYRTDLMARAGLPTDRDALAALWPTWQAYAEVADRFAARVPDAKFADSAGTVYTAMLNQAEENYFRTADDAFIGDSNPAVARAFTLAGAIGAQHRTAALTTFTQPWNVGINQGAFATMTCPAWMLAQIKQAGGPGAAGTWDVTTVPGGAGNWGGSYLVVPAQGQHIEAAYAAAEWLTAPAQQKRLFESDNILPSQPEVYRDPTVLARTDPYFRDAPVGRIYAASSDAVRPNHRGVRDADIRPIFGRALGRIEDGKQTVDQAWQQAVDEAHAVLR